MEPAVTPRHRIDPDARRAAAHQRRVGLERVGHRLEGATEFDQQAIAIVAVEKIIFFEDVVEAATGRDRERFGERWEGGDDRINPYHRAKTRCSFERSEHPAPHHTRRRTAWPQLR